MISRIATAKIKELATYYKVVAVIGPRQSGKTTLVRNEFPDKPYVSLENLDSRRYAIEDPRGFLDKYNDGAIFDEIQQTPELFSYLQQIVDESQTSGKFVLTGSNNFLLQEKITQSLAGRVGYLELLPFSLPELKSAGLNNDDESQMIRGFYPPVYDQNIPAPVWYGDYIRTYIEKDVRQLKSISNLMLFERFVRLMAGRVGQELNYSALSVEVGVDVKTIQSWTSLLESSFIIYKLKPYYRNFNKTIVKRPKLYFIDSGLVCALLGIKDSSQLNHHPLRGAIFENTVVTEFIKYYTNIGERPPLYFWRDKSGREIDLILDEGGRLLPIEIKAGKTYQASFAKNLLYWMKLVGLENAKVIYRGDDNFVFSNGIDTMNWRSIYPALQNWRR